MRYLHKTDYKIWFTTPVERNDRHITAHVQAYCMHAYIRDTTGLIEQDLTSHQTHYRLYRGRFLQFI